MAFVYQSQRWKNQLPNQLPGPAYYNPIQKNKSIGGIIAPQHNTFIYKKQLDQQQQKLLIACLVQKKERRNHYQNQKLFKRAQSAKLFRKPQQILSDQFQNDTPVNNRQLQITNVEKNQQKSTKKSTTNYKKINKKNYSASQIQLTNHSLFNDKNLRIKNCEQPLKTKEKIRFSNSFVDRNQSNKKNQNLLKFVQNKDKNSFQNSFYSNQGSSSLKKQQNFIIASGNCTKISTNEMKILENCQEKQNLKYEAFQDAQTTAIDDSYNEQDSIQYITDSTPGPGQYELRKDKTIQKSRFQKFGVTQKRFKEPKTQQLFFSINTNIPNFKKSSRAPQSKVAFFKSRPQTAKQNKTQFLVYQDFSTIQNKCIKDLIKDRKDPGTFLSKTNRFDKIKREPYYGPDFFSKDQPKPILLPDSTYMSKVSRHERPKSPTANVDFQGQEYKTISKKIQHFNERKQIFDHQIPGFQVSEARFKYKKMEENNEKLNRTLKTNEINKKQLKCYTFQRQERKQKSPQNTNPAPWAYSTQMKWVKPSHHVRYKF